ncbi:MAG TPA: hypothetical protein VEG34_00015, partial [Thermoanaerobaculia bacterium]|nr:hypothetical protein [Thermoanaerobaculia bacterium]
ALLAREPDAYQKKKIELSALVQLQEKLILESQDDLESWTEEERSRYHRLLVESVGDSASLLGLVKKEEAATAPPPARGPRGNPPGKDCICPFCTEYCGCPFVCFVITDPPETCNNYYQWVYHLYLRRWERWRCDPTGNLLPKCNAPGFVNCPG